MAEKMTYEKAMERIEEILSELESGDATLAESMKRYEEGIGLIRACNEELEQATQTVRMLSATPDGKAILTDFNGEDKND